MFEVGRAFLLRVGAGSAVGSYTTVAGLCVTSSQQNGKHLDLTGSGVFTGSAAETRIKTNALSGAVDDYQLSFENGEVLTGRFLITRLEYAGDFNGERTYTVALSSVGKVDDSRDLLPGAIEDAGGGTVFDAWEASKPSPTMSLAPTPEPDTKWDRDARAAPEPPMGHRAQWGEMPESYARWAGDYADALAAERARRGEVK
jgi:predicted secreted protein